VGHVRRDFKGLHYVVHLHGVHRLDLRKSVHFHFHMWIPHYKWSFRYSMTMLQKFREWDEYLYYRYDVERLRDGTTSALDFWIKVRDGYEFPKMRGRTRLRKYKDYWPVEPELLGENFDPLPVTYLPIPKRRVLWYWDHVPRSPNKTVLTAKKPRRYYGKILVPMEFW